jgi:hypothetical protein
MRQSPMSSESQHAGPIDKTSIRRSTSITWDWQLLNRGQRHKHFPGIPSHCWTMHCLAPQHSRPAQIEYEEEKEAHHEQLVSPEQQLLAHWPACAAKSAIILGLISRLGCLRRSARWTHLWEIAGWWICSSTQPSCTNIGNRDPSSSQAPSDHRADPSCAVVDQVS